ncbi:universal stress protein Slr1101-like [Haliotis cracherodii]|uniref:universal stress protein Slr1101-like n=1 Tax=Haliotis cracherodii TaxID=6455 RepID=UPI0039E89C12
MASSENQRNIIVAIDGSDSADFALDWYCKNVHQKHDHVVLVHCPELNRMLHSQRWNNSVYVFDREVMEAMLKDEQHKIQKDLEKFAEKLKHHGIGGKVKSVMASKPGEGIIKACEDEHGEMIIIGSRGLGTLRRTFMGSVSDYVVHHSHVPVFVCRNKEHHHHHHHDHQGEQQKCA